MRADPRRKGKLHGGQGKLDAGRTSYEKLSQMGSAPPNNPISPVLRPWALSEVEIAQRVNPWTWLAPVMG